jgi:long-chain acyl-CoA synthetase
MNRVIANIAPPTLIDAEKVAVLSPSLGRSITHAELNDRSYFLAHAIRRRGLDVKSHVAILMENVPEYFVAAWAAHRAGLYYTPVNWHLTPHETHHILKDSDAQALVATASSLRRIGDVATSLEGPGFLVTTGNHSEKSEDLEEIIAKEAETDQDFEFEELVGSPMFYSSGTSGQPKGIKHPIPLEPFRTPSSSDQGVSSRAGFDADTVYLCPAPLYHASPLSYSMAVQRTGGTVILMEKFDPEEMLRLIEQYRVTHMHVVPTMFVRLLKLPEDVRRSADLRSLQAVSHSSAPCPVAVKEQMLEWFGPIIGESYSGSEGVGRCAIGPQEWLLHKGSVGKSQTGPIHILDDEGVPVNEGEIGVVWFEDAANFEYHHDPRKSTAAFNDHGWSTLGDMGYLDDEGYLFLSDRRTNLIISGGVNIYPQEVESVLALHPDVLDIAVIGIPDDDLGQRVVAIVTAADPNSVGPELAQSIIEFCRTRLAHYKCPREAIFDSDLPRLPTGKLAKRILHERYT